MTNVLEFAILIGIVAAMGLALAEVAYSNDSGPHKVMWTVAIVLFPGLGALAYLLGRRP